MGKKVERSLSREELADYLAELSQQLRRGQVEIEDRVWTVPEQVYTEVKLKEKHGEVVVKISWQWSSREAGPGMAAQAVPSPRPPGSFKALKVRLAASFKDLQRLLRQGLMPEPRVMQSFVEDSQTMAAQASPAWRQAMTAYLTHLENLQRAVENQQLEEARLALQHLADGMASCHREFK